MSNTKQLVKELIKLLRFMWRTVVMSKNGGKCVHCEKIADDPHHICSKGSTGFMAAFDPANGVPMCREDHTKYHAINDPDIKASIMSYLERAGIDYDELRLQSNQNHKKSFENYKILESNLLVALREKAV